MFYHNISIISYCAVLVKVLEDLSEIWFLKLLNKNHVVIMLQWLQVREIFITLSFIIEYVSCRCKRVLFVTGSQR